MAARDYKFYQYLVEALRFKVKYPTKNIQSGYFRDPKTGYSFEYKDIFKWSRRMFPQFYNKYFEDDLVFAKQILYGIDNKKDPQLIRYVTLGQTPVIGEEIHEEIVEESKKAEEKIQKEKDESTLKGGATAKKTIQELKNGPATAKLTEDQKRMPATKKAERLELVEKGGQSLKGSEYAKLAAKTALSKIPEVKVPVFAEIGLYKLMQKIPWSVVIPTIFTTTVGYFFGGGGSGALLGALVGVPVGMQVNKIITGGRDEPLYGESLPDVGGYNPQIKNLTQGTRSVASNLASNLGSGLVKGALRRAAVGVAVNPLTIWIIGGILVFFVLVLMLMGGLNLLQTTALFPPFGDGLSQNETTSGLLKISKVGPAAVNNGEDISYSLTVTYTGAGQANVEITDTIPVNTVFKSASDGGTARGNIVSWVINNLENNQTIKQPKILTLVVTPQTPDIWVTNMAEGKILSTSSTTLPGEDVAANQDTCSGRYKLGSPFGNFGDPGCNFDKDLLYQQLEQLDPTNASYWFNQVIRCESGYNPNAYNPRSTSGKGAFGFYQMNPAGSGNGEFDSGNVNWPKQTSNAINYSSYVRKAGVNPWRYWECAMERW